MKPRRMSGWFVAVALTLCASGCSFALIETRGHESHVRPTHLACTRSYALPVVDTVIAGGLAAASVSSFTTEPSDDGVTKTPAKLVGVGAVIAAVPFVLSAVYGYVVVTDCNGTPAQPRSARRGVSPPRGASLRP